MSGRGDPGRVVQPLDVPNLRVLGQRDDHWHRGQRDVHVDTIVPFVQAAGSETVAIPYTYTVS